MAESIQTDNPPQAAQPATNPLVNHLGSRACWLVGSGRPKDPSKPNEPMKAPCDRNGYPLKSWQTAPLDTYAQAVAKISPPIVRFVGIRSNAAGDAAGAYVAGLDLDDVLNTGQGCIDAVAWWVWSHYPTYTEITPSGLGLRMWWIVEGDAQPVTVKTERDRKTGLSEVAFTAGVFNDKTRTVEPQTFNIGRELYYRADRFLIVTGKPYAWLVDGSPDPLRAITAGDLAAIAATVKMQRPPYIVEAQNADATAGVVQIGATTTYTIDETVVIDLPAAVPQPATVAAAQIIEAQPVAQPVAQPAQVQPSGAQAYAMAALQDEAQAVATTREGGRNDALNKAAYKIGGLVGAGAIDEATAAQALESAARQAGLSEREAQATARSGLTAGAAAPRKIPERPAQPAQTGQGRAGVNMQSMRARINAKREIKIEAQQ